MMMIMRRNIYMVSQVFLSKQAVGGLPPQYAPAPLLPLWVPCAWHCELTAPAECKNRNVAVGSHGQYVPTLTAVAA